MNITEKMSIEKAAFDNFMARFKAGELGTKRLGQAFFDQFGLFKMNNNHLADAIYEADDDTAKFLINDNFNFH